MAGKPNPKAFRRGAQALNLPPEQVGMVGDQLFTDVLGGNLAGLHTILVRPLIDNALPHTRAARLLEQMEKSGLVSSMATNGNRDLLVPRREE